MKFLIWILCIFVESIIFHVISALLPVSLFGYGDDAALTAGLILGLLRLSTAAYFLYFLPRSLCKRWDSNRLLKKAHLLADRLNISFDIPVDLLFYYSEDVKGANSYLQSCLEKHLINEDQRKILLEACVTNPRSLSKIALPSDVSLSSFSKKQDVRLPYFSKKQIALIVIGAIAVFIFWIFFFLWLSTLY